MCALCPNRKASAAVFAKFPYTETMEALESIDESELTASELSYYIGVMSRIQQMVLAAVG